MQHKILLLIPFFLFFSDGSDLIVWNADKKIEWSDFKGKPPKNKDFKLAISSLSISIKTDSYYEGEIPNYSVQTFFKKNKSWTITSSEESLNHERLHFDIAELYARKIRKTIKQFQSLGETDILVYKTSYQALLKEHSDIQKKYDSESYFNKLKQKEWINKISNNLEDLKDYIYEIQN